MNYSKFKVAAVTPLIALTLSACGGGGGISGKAFDELQAEANTLMERVGEIGEYNAETDSFDNRTLKTALNGTATYAGNARMWVADGGADKAQARLESDETPDVLADLNLSADFEDEGSISGTITNFQANEGVTAEGSVDITNGTITADSDGFGVMAASFNGEITVTEDGETEVSTFGGSMDGRFLGDDGAGLVGGMQGTFSQESDGSFFAGEWIAARD